MGTLLTFERQPRPASTWTPRRVDLESADVLRGVADALADAAKQLPRGSAWRDAFIGIRGHVLETIGEEAS